MPPRPGPAVLIALPGRAAVLCAAMLLAAMLLAAVPLAGCADSSAPPPATRDDTTRQDMTRADTTRQDTAIVPITADTVAADTAAADMAAAAPTGLPEAGTLVDYGAVLPALRRQTTLPVRLPVAVPYGGEVTQVFGHLMEATDTSYAVALDALPTCRGASACSLGRLRATAAPAAREEAGVAAGTVTPADPARCGAGSCYDALRWVEDGVVYVLELKPAGGDAAARLRAAAQAVARYE